MTEPAAPAVRTTRAERMTMPLARQVVKDLAVEHGACIRPIQLRRTNVDTGEVDQVLVPCGHTLAHVCPSCAERAKTLRAAQCREGWHLEDEPDLTPDPATEDQQWWVTMRADAQQSRDQAETAGQDTADFDELIGELDEEIAKSGVRGNVAPDRPARRHRSTRRRQDTPDLPRRKVSPRTSGKTYTAPDGTTFRPSMFVTLTCPSYGRVDHQGVPGRPGRLRLRPGRPGRADLRRAVRPVHPEPAPLPRHRRAVLRRRRTPAAPSSRMSTSPCGAPSPGPSCAGCWPRPTTRSGGLTLPVRYRDGDELPVWHDPVGGYVDPATGEVLPTWDEALDAISAYDLPWHVARFGDRFDAQGVLAGSPQAARCIGYLTKYLTKQVGDCHQATSRRAA